jgi:DNA-binding response OmpR family regulator
VSKILIIEDDTNLSDLYQAKFSMEGFEVVVANDGDQGIASSVSEKPSIILLDILMPNVNGFEVLRQLKTNPETKDTPVIVYTNLGTTDADEKRELAFSLGASDYLVKALHEPESIVQRVNAILKPNDAGDASAADEEKMAA